jgi:carbamoyl-phosphate synthase large subunit
MNVQYAIQRDKVFVLEVNPRASRTVPYVSKAVGVPLAKVAVRLMTGKKLRDMNLPIVETNGVAELAVRDYYAVKSPVFPFSKFRGVDTILGPEMRSTGEVMGIAKNFGQAFAKAQLSAGQKMPRSGTIFISVSDHDKLLAVPLARELQELGYRIIGTRGTATALQSHGIKIETIYKVNEGRPNIVDLVKTGKVDLIINTPLGRESFYDEKSIRRASVRYGVPCITRLSAANAAARALRSQSDDVIQVSALQDLHLRSAAAQSQTSGK